MEIYEVGGGEVCQDGGGVGGGYGTGWEGRGWWTGHGLECGQEERPCELEALEEGDSGGV